MLDVDMSVGFIFVLWGGEEKEIPSFRRLAYRLLEDQRKKTSFSVKIGKYGGRREGGGEGSGSERDGGKLKR